MPGKISKSDIVKLFLPALVWFAWIGSFYNQSLTLFADARKFFVYLNFHLNHLSRGVFPLWNPFDVWGRTEGMMGRYVSELNPFYAIILILQSVGISFGLSYFLFMTGYFLLGCLGFYLLAKELLSDRGSAYVAYLLFLFSAAGLEIFNNTAVIMMLVSTIWFYYFFVLFLRTYQFQAAMGITFTLMLVAITYVPFYFITIFALFLLACVIFYPKECWRHLGRIAQFIRQNVLFVIGCVMSVGIACLPGLFWLQESRSGTLAILWRLTGSATGQAMDLTVDAINISGLTGHITLDNLFNHLHLTDGYSFYLPVAFFLFLLMGGFLPITRRLWMLASIGIVLFLISLVDLTPVHEYLHTHIGMFKKFRNMHFFSWYIYAIAVLFVAEQWRLFLRMNREGLGRKMFFSLMITGAWFLVINFLNQFDSVILSTYITVGYAWILFLILLWFSVDRMNKLVLGGALFVLIALQPYEVYQYVAVNNEGKGFAYSKAPATRSDHVPRFRWNRPIQDGSHKAPMKGIADIVDNDGYVQESLFSGLTNVHQLQGQFTRKELAPYINHKFVVYDHRDSTRDVRHYLSDYSPVSRASGLIDVIDYDLNTITFQTRFSKKQFLVYNDAYHPSWRGTIDGEPLPIYLANGAFKGMWIEPGEHTVKLRFGDWWLEGLYFCIALTLMGYLCLTGWFLMRRPADD